MVIRVSRLTSAELTRGCKQRNWGIGVTAFFCEFCDLRVIRYEIHIRPRPRELRDAEIAEFEVGE